MPEEISPAKWRQNTMDGWFIGTNMVGEPGIFHHHPDPNPERWGVDHQAQNSVCMNCKEPVPEEIRVAYSLMTMSSSYQGLYLKPVPAEFGGEKAPDGK
jgi:hypothetical protein